MKNIFKNKNMKEVRIMKATKRLTALVLSLITAFSCMISASALTPDELVYDDTSAFVTKLREVHNFFDVMLPTDITISGPNSYTKKIEELKKSETNDNKKGYINWEPRYWSEFEVKITAKSGKVKVAGATYNAVIYSYDENGELNATPVMETNGIKTGQGIKLPQDTGVYYVVVTTCNGGYRAGMKFAVGMDIPDEEPVRNVGYFPQDWSGYHYLEIII